jgi:SlyX protein
MQERLIELETRITFQEEAIQALNDTVVRQQREIDQLTRMVKLINHQLRGFNEGLSSGPDNETPPPHY